MGDHVVITWKDGLPDDPLERAQIEQILTSSGLTSKYSAIRRLRDGNDEEAAAEIERIALEEGLDAAREAAMAAGGVGGVQEESPEPERSESSRRTEAAMKQQIGWNDKNAGRHSLRPKRGG
jgi:hypothetical protein